MVTSVTVRGFKRFEDETTFDLGEAIVLAGPNNSGKTTLLQAIALWQLGLRHWLSRREPGKTTAKARAGVILSRQQLTAIPVREMNLLWHGRQTSGAEAPQGRKRRIEIILRGDDDGGWECGIEFEYGTPESVNVRPRGAREGADISDFPHPAARRLEIVHIPPLSGIEREEPRRDRGYQDLLIGQGRPGEVLRNLLLEVSETPTAWSELESHISALFGVRILTPAYSTSTPHIICEYRPSKDARPLDVANAGSGFLQVLLLLAFFYARPNPTLLLLDEPDAHLHVILQREAYELLRRVAAAKRTQLILATHSEVLLDLSSPEQVISFVRKPPSKLAHQIDRDRLREALKRLSTTDLLLAEQSGAILYVEDGSDERVLSAWARVLGHEAAAFLDRPFVHPLRGNSLKEARDHFFAFRSVMEDVRGLVILDGDDREFLDGATPDGLVVSRWRRYEIENYLLIPRAIAAVGDWGPDTLIEEAVLRVFHEQVPAGADLFGEAIALRESKASIELLPGLLRAAGRELPKRDYFLIAEQMRLDEIHPEVKEKLDLIAETLNPSSTA